MKSIIKECGGIVRSSLWLVTWDRKLSFVRKLLLSIRMIVCVPLIICLALVVLLYLSLRAIFFPRASDPTPTTKALIMCIF